jgi:FkbM family methyltransferase
LFIDVGANVGRYAIMAARQMADKGNVVAIEPEPDNYNSLIRNIKLNKLTNVHAFNLACYFNESDLKLFLDPYGTGGHSIVTHASERCITIHTKKLDDILRDLGNMHVDLIKIDVEGATPEVLAGATETIASNNGVRILFEHYNDEHFTQSCEILKSRGFAVTKIVPWGYNFMATKKVA